MQRSPAGTHHHHLLLMGLLLVFITRGVVITRQHGIIIITTKKVTTLLKTPRRGKADLFLRRSRLMESAEGEKEATTVVVVIESMLERRTLAEVALVLIVHPRPGRRLTATTETAVVPASPTIE